MEKVKVSAEIAKALTYIIVKTGNDVDLQFSKLGSILYNQAQAKHTHKNLIPLLQTENHQALFNALQYGFEIEEIYNLEDQIVRLDGNAFITGKKIERVVRVGEFYLTYNHDKCVLKNQVRHATEQEIVEEREIEMWKALGRIPSEFNWGDVCLLKNRIVQINSDSDVTEMLLAYEKGELIGICPATSVVLFNPKESVSPATELRKDFNEHTRRKIAGYETEIKHAELDLTRATNQIERLHISNYIDEQRENLNELKRSLITEVSSDYE